MVATCCSARAGLVPSVVLLRRGPTVIRDRQMLVLEIQLLEGRPSSRLKVVLVRALHGLERYSQIEDITARHFLGSWCTYVRSP